MLAITCATLVLASLAAQEPAADAPTRSATPVQVFVLAGQSNMEGKAQLKLLEYQAAQPGTRERFAHLRDAVGWIVRDDVYIKFLDRSGLLTVGFGSPGRIGPELEFGHVVGDALDAPVVIVKAAWGGKSLFRDFRPPGAGPPPAEELARLVEAEQRRRPEATAEEVEASFGRYYRLMLDEVRGVVADVGATFPELAGREAELRGLVWFQGWNDMVNREYSAAYAGNMAHFVRDVRRDLGAPRLPVVIGQLGVGGTGKPDAGRDAFKAAQAEAARLPEFAGTVALVRTDAFWDTDAQAVFDRGWRENLEEWERVGSDYPYHYLGSARTYCDIGRAFGQAALALIEAERRTR